MASQKWIALFALPALFTLMVEVRTSSSLPCLKEVIRKLDETICVLKNCSLSGKSTNSSVKLERRRDAQRFHRVFHRTGLLVLDTLVIHTQAGKKPGTSTQLLPATQNRIIYQFEFSLTF